MDIIVADVVHPHLRGHKCILDYQGDKFYAESVLWTRYNDPQSGTQSFEKSARVQCARDIKYKAKVNVKQL